MKNLIACRLGCYGKFAHRAWAHLPQLGIRHLELMVPQPQEMAELKKKLADHGLSASSLQATCDVQKADAAEVMKPQLAACAELGAGICFLSARAGETDRKVVYGRLRAIAEAADKVGVTVALETHPDLATNGDVGRQTVQAVRHPRLRINFDTANIYFYNQGTTAVKELAKEIDHVAAVHVKDTDGGFQSWNFPTLGTGVVDFPEVFRMLGERGFRGPYTMELEGVKGVELDEAGQLKYVADSVAYLRRIGAFG